MEPLYVMRDGQLLGPYSPDEIRELIRIGTLSENDLAQRSEADPWRPISSFLPPARRRIPFAKVFIGLLVLAFLGFLLITAGLVYAPLDEWAGLSQSAFDQRAIEEGHLPAGATRVLYYDTGFTDSARWVAYSADRETLDRRFESLSRKSEKITDWPPAQNSHGAIRTISSDNPVPPPPRAGWRNRGYWDLGPNSRGKFAKADSEVGSMAVYYDTENLRIYYMELGR